MPRQGRWSILVFHGVSQPTVEDRKRTNRSAQGLRASWNSCSNMGRTVFARLFELAMRIERERFLGADHYERTG